MVRIMDPDEQLYEAAAKELASSPRTGLLAKCMAKSQGDENKAKARYLEARVGEMKDIIRAEAKKKEEEAQEKHLPVHSLTAGPFAVVYFILFIFFAIILVAIALAS
jgi:hypothetical protein